MTSKLRTSRVTAGELRYRTIYQPASSSTRPVSQKLREAIFNTLGHDLSGLKVLDLYAGSAALAIEALSRGAVLATTVESDHLAQRAILANERDLGVALGLRPETVETFLKEDKNTYDIVFFDPPYAIFDISRASEASTRLAKDGVLIISCSAKEALPEKLGAASIVKARTYDETQLAYYK